MVYINKRVQQQGVGYIRVILWAHMFLFVFKSTS